MSRRAAAFTQADIARALRAVEQVAPGRMRVRVTREGEIVVEPAARADFSALSSQGEPDDDGDLARGLEVVP